MNRLIGLFAGMAAGAALMYFTDPEKGANRRAMIRDKATGLKNDLADAAGKQARDLQNRAAGLLHEAKSVATEDAYVNESAQTS
jgi:hypothetical protein